MKKNYLFLTLLFILTIATAKAQSSLDSTYVYTNCNNNNDTPKIQFYTFINPLQPNTTLIIYFGDGTNYTQTTFTNGSVYGSHTYATEGTYSMKFLLKVNGSAVDSEIRTMRIYCSNIDLRLYADNNSNCVYNSATEPLYMYSNSKIEVKENSIIIDTIPIFGFVSYKLKLSSVYIFRLLNPPLGTSATCPSTGSITYTTPSTPSTSSASFGIQCGSASQFDLEARVRGRFRPVSFSMIDVWANTLGVCGNVSGTVTLQIDPKYSYSSATTTPTSVSGNTVTWNLTNLNSITSQSIHVQVVPATTVSLGDTVCSTVNITPTSGDINVTNNTMTRCTTVVSSIDPNTKSVSPEGIIKSGDVLTYRLDFENLGSDTAFNIHILDTLSGALDKNSIEITNASHPVSFSVRSPLGSNDIVNFDFANIKLPDSNSKAYNHGFVEFKIKARNNLAPSTIITNRAGIYFDINPVVMTNSVQNMTEPLGVKQIKTSAAAVYPNPVHDVLTIRTEKHQYNNAKLLNTIGQTVAEETLTNNISQIDVKALPNGIYYLVLSGEAGIKTEKIEKQ